MADEDPRAAVDRLEHDLDPALARPDDLRRILPAPGESEAPRRVERDELAGHHRPVAVRDADRAAGRRSTSATAASSAPAERRLRPPAPRPAGVHATTVCAPRSRHRSPSHPSPASVRRLSSSIAVRSASSCSSRTTRPSRGPGRGRRAAPGTSAVSRRDAPRRACRPEHGEMLADRRPRSPRTGRDLAGRQLAVAELAQDRAPPRFGEGMEGRLEHGRHVSDAYVSVN